MTEKLDQAALDYHEFPKPGKVCIGITKPFTTMEELALAYSPGVAEPVKAIAENPEDAYRYTAKGNLIAIITDGTAVLGLGRTGPLSSKPVMEGKAVLFKKFANVDVFDIEVECENTEDFIRTVENISPTFGGINLEDIAAPACFEIERVLNEKLDIPVFHDDQHGTAIIVTAGLINALELQGKTIEEAKVVCVGAGAAAVASMKLCRALGANPDNLIMLDRQGVIHDGRDWLPPHKQEFAITTDARTLDDAIEGADVFIGLSGPNLMNAEQLKKMAPKPVVFALSNPDPEIHPALAHSVRDDIIMATGRSDFPNQINNVLGFPYIFRGALDVRAKRITQEMNVACVHAIRKIAKLPVPQLVLDAYSKDEMSFGPDYIIPTPLDPRLFETVPAAIAQAAIDSGVARTGYPEHYPSLEESENNAA